MKIIERVKQLDFPLGQYVVVGGAMEVHGLRPAKDIDIVAAPALIEHLLAKGWKDTGCWNCPGCGRLFLENGDVDVMSNFSHGSKYRADTQSLIDCADIIDGIPFVKLTELVKWKRAAGRPKDLLDIEMIEKYLKNNA